VEWPEFHAFCQVLNPQSEGVVTTAHSQIAKKIKESWNCHKDTVRQILQSAISSIHISLDILLPVLEDYGIVQQLGAVVADNASPNNTLCKAIENYMWDEQEIEWNAEHWRIRCSGHIINLAVQAFLFANFVEVEELESYDD
jgi:hypothetical protein